MKIPEEEPDEPLRGILPWLFVAGVITCILVATPVIATLIANGWWSP
jgi:hypothetical protein